jgi:hypothetical protein
MLARNPARSNAESSASSKLIFSSATLGKACRVSVANVSFVTAGAVASVPHEAAACAEAKAPAYRDRRPCGTLSRRSAGSRPPESSARTAYRRNPAGRCNHRARGCRPPFRRAAPPSGRPRAASYAARDRARRRRREGRCRKPSVGANLLADLARLVGVTERRAVHEVMEPRLAALPASGRSRRSSMRR